MRLLLAEDEQLLSEAICEILSHHHFSVDAVYNGQDALDYLTSGDYDGAIIDVMMPKLDGFSVVKKLRDAGHMIPILILTAKNTTDDKVWGLDIGADDYLAKPFEGKELVARVRAITRRQPTLQNTNLQTGNLTLNRTTFELSTPTGQYHLSNKEFQLLELLMSNAKQIIPSERLMEKIWGYEAEVDMSVIWVYISSLRKKLQQLNSTVEIKAVRGVGYYIGDDDQ